MAHSEVDRFEQIYRSADKLIAEADKEDLAEAARIPALDLAQYQARYGEHVKAHDTPAHGRVAQLYPEEDYGMIQTDDGRELYFHRNSVLNASFDKLEPRTEVRFAEVAADLGPKASTVTIVGKHHVVG